MRQISTILVLTICLQTVSLAQLTGTYKYIDPVPGTWNETVDSAFVEFLSDTTLTYYKFGTSGQNALAHPMIGFAIAKWKVIGDSLFADTESLDRQTHDTLLKLVMEQQNAYSNRDRPIDHYAIKWDAKIELDSLSGLTLYLNNKIHKLEKIKE